MDRWLLSTDDGTIIVPCDWTPDLAPATLIAQEACNELDTPGYLTAVYLRKEQGTFTFHTTDCDAAEQGTHCACPSKVGLGYVFLAREAIDNQE
jgi:hypothetical protein